jgi:hypothetical protein
MLTTANAPTYRHLPVRFALVCNKAQERSYIFDYNKVSCDVAEVNYSGKKLFFCGRVVNKDTKNR